MKKYFTIVPLLAAVLLIVCAEPGARATAQTTLPTPPKPSGLASLRFRQLTTEDGLPHSRVEALLQDRRGFMWFGTGDGLARYDGYRMTSFRHEPNNPVS